MDVHAFDWTETLKKYKGNHQTAQKMTTMFFAELSEAEHSVKTAFAQKNPEKLYAALHGLHGICCFVAVPELKAVVRKFCDASHLYLHKDAQQEIENLRFLLDDFNTACTRLMTYRKDFQQNESS